MTGGGMETRRAHMDMIKVLLPPPDDNVIAYVKAILTLSLHFHTDVPLEDIVAFVHSIIWPLI
jgi:hypothetical protein